MFTYVFFLISFLLQGLEYGVQSLTWKHKPEHQSLEQVYEPTPRAFLFAAEYMV